MGGKFINKQIPTHRQSLAIKELSVNTDEMNSAQMCLDPAVLGLG